MAKEKLATIKKEKFRHPADNCQPREKIAGPEEHVPWQAVDLCRSVGRLTPVFTIFQLARHKNSALHCSINTLMGTRVQRRAYPYMRVPTMTVGGGGERGYILNKGGTHQGRPPRREKN